ncbi:beta-trefoil DNA-binding domain-containing protein [Blakeslea trispora]|nr:beta-trefoil DNA-binding domain-containing protein [Blakeslea trispora]
MFQSQSVVLSPPKLTIHISGEAINQTGVIEWQTSSGAIVDTAVTSTNAGSIFGRCVSKQLYINDADEKRKRVEVLAKLQLGNGVSLGTFPSKGIKVISKPSKKRQSIKNMELCIHHGTTISLFNRIRSQTVSTKYLGVSSGSSATSNNNNKSNSNANGTCFVARTGSWDPFVIWIVDTSRSPDNTNMPRPNQHHPNNPNFPPPPAIALQTPSSTQQPVAILYNQPVVLQCVTTGLVSPVMVIRKVDKGSMVLGGNRVEDFSGRTGGECGDETLGDPVSQLHKVAFQIVQDPTFAQHNKTARYHPSMPTSAKQPSYEIPQSCHPVTYLACLNDVVGMHKTNYNRHLVETCQQRLNEPNHWSELISNGTENKLFESMDTNDTPASSANPKARRRMSSISSTETKGRRGSLADRRGSSVSDSSGLEGACWTEDVSDAAVWTIVGTDCANYTFWTPFNNPFNLEASHHTDPISPFPVIHELIAKKDQLTLSGEHISEDISVWFGDIKASKIEFKSRDSIVCSIPDAQELQNSPTLLIEEDGLKKKIPLLLVRGDGIVYRTDRYYTF